jgi:hypothetical protein
VAPRSSCSTVARVDASSSARLSSAALLGASGIQFLIVFSGSRGRFLRRRIGELFGTANRRRALVDDAENRLKHQRVEQVGAQQQETDDPKRADIRR